MTSKRVNAFVIHRGGIPCALIGKGVLHPAGVLAPAVEGETPHEIRLERELKKHPSVNARRRTIKLIERTIEFCEKVAGSLVDQQPLVARVCGATGDWSVESIPELQPCPHCAGKGKVHRHKKYIPAT